MFRFMTSFYFDNVYAYANGNPISNLDPPGLRPHRLRKAGARTIHWNAFKQHGIERVLIAYDRDEAGERAAGKLAERLNAEGLHCYRIGLEHDFQAQGLRGLTARVDLINALDRIYEIRDGTGVGATEMFWKPRDMQRMARFVR